MNEHPILFSREMVRAILVGHKTQTRRVVMPQIDWQVDIFQRRKNGTLDQFTFSEFIARCPYGLAGDRLWVRETFAYAPADTYVYRADFSEPIHEGLVERAGEVIPLVWRPSIHMPRKASRIALNITAVRIERVQEIIREGAKAEGVSNLWSWDVERNDKHPEHFRRALLNPYIANYSVLWDEINAERGYGWDANPWVWVIEFQKVMA
jgi:hypothetical protein